MTGDVMARRCLGLSAASRAALVAGSLAAASVGAFGTGCQTLDDIGGSISGALGTSQAEVLETQKSIVVNYLDQAQPQAALGEVRRMLSEHPNNPEVLNLAGLTHLALKNSRVAARFFERAYKIKGDTPTALNLSSAYIELRDFDAAGKILRKLIVDGQAREYRYRERIFHNMGIVAQESGKTKLAERYYDRAIEENPVFYKSHIQMAKVHARAGRPREALRSAQSAQQACPRCMDALDVYVSAAIAARSPADALPAVNDFLRGEDLSSGEKRQAENLRARLRSAMERGGVTRGARR